MPAPPTPQIDATWERRCVSSAGDRTSLMLRVTLPAALHAYAHPPVDVAFALDRSGSMAGEPVALVKQAVNVAAGMLRPEDRVALVVYDDRIDVLHPLQPASSNARQALRCAMDGVDARGSTNLGDGWLTACQQVTSGMPEPNGGAARIRRSLLLTDGLANVGITSLDDLVTHAHQLRKRGVSTSTLGVGIGFDEGLLSSMAEAGGGNFQYIETPGELPDFFRKELGEILSIVATQFRIHVTLPVDVRGEAISAFPSERRHKTFEIALGDLPAGDETIVIFDIETPRGRDGVELPVDVRAEWVDPDTARLVSVTVALQPLDVAQPRVAEAAPVDLTVAEQSALQHAARDQREAMRLDRSGHYTESRRLHYQAHDRLYAAPQSAIVFERMAEAAAYAAYDAQTPYSEQTRKQAVHHTMRRARGRSDTR